MSDDPSLCPSGARLAAVGLLIWLVVLAGVFSGAFWLSIFDRLFLLAPWVVVPLSLSLVPARAGSRFPKWSGRMLAYFLFCGAALATLSFFIPAGPRAAALTCIWLTVCLTFAVDGLLRLFGSSEKSFEQFCFAAGEGYLLVGGLWLLASRLGRQPVGFREPIVLLTAIHFHYAGFMAAVLTGLVASRLGKNGVARYLRAALSCAVLGPGLLGLAFLAGPKFKLAAVVLMVIGECGLALATMRIGMADARGFGGRMLLLGSGSVILGMFLAGVWAIGEYPLHAFVNLEQMARFHGVLNSVGFGLCSLIGWTYLRRNSSAVQAV